MSAHLSHLQLLLDEILIQENPAAARLRDYCPNGLQVEGSSRVSHVVFGVTASLEFLERSIELGADAVVVHHGILWNYQERSFPKSSVLHRRLKAALAADLNVFAYHLPLDVHPEVGNNVAFARAAGLIPREPFGEGGGILMSSLPGTGASLESFASTLQPPRDPLSGLPSSPILAPGDGRTLQKVAVCTGAAGAHFEEAIASGADAFLTGEISEQHWHIARETGVAYIAAGHHFTESFGIRSLMEAAELRLARPEVRFQFLDIPNPI